MEHWRLTDVESLHRDFPTLPIVCTHRVPDEEMWMAALEAGASDVCPADDVANVLTSVLRIPTLRADRRSISKFSAVQDEDACRRPLFVCKHRFQPERTSSGSHILPPCYTHCFMLEETLEQGRQLTDAALDRLIPLETEHPESIHKAMRHSVFAGGKRLRPVLCMEAGRMVAGSLPAAH